MEWNNVVRREKKKSEEIIEKLRPRYEEDTEKENRKSKNAKELRELGKMNCAENKR